MEKMPIPHADRVIGDANVSTEETGKFLDNLPVDEEGNPITDTKKILSSIFEQTAPDKKLFEGLELEKTERDLYIIHIATEAVKRFAREFGRENFVDLPLDNIHILKGGGVSEYTKGRLGTGSHATVLGQVLIDRRNDLQTAITTFHELWHTLGSHEAIQVTTKGEIDWYRAGFSIKSREGEKEYFYRIDEALTGLMTKRFVDEVLLADPSFTEEIKKLEALNQEIDTTRRGEVKMLHEIAQNIYSRSNGEFQSPEEVINLFLKGQVTGNILSIARVIEKSFGKGSFRKLGQITQE